MLGDGDTPSTGEKKNPEERGATHPSKGPVQFVVVQQPSTAGDGDFISDLFKKLWPNQEDDRSNRQPSRKVIVKSSPVNLLLAIVLVLLFGGQVAGLIYRDAESKTSEARQIESDRQSLEQLVKLTMAIDRVSHPDDGSIKVTIANPTSSGGTQGANTVGTDPQIHADLRAVVDALDRKPSPSEPEVKVVLVPSPMQQLSLNPAGGVPTSSSGKQILIHPNLSIMPCIHDTTPTTPTTPIAQATPATKQAALGDSSQSCKRFIQRADLDSKQPTIPIDVNYQNLGPDDLLLLDVRGYLSQDLPFSGDQSLNGVCANILALLAGTPLPHNAQVPEVQPLLVGLDRGWTRQDRKRAESAWKEGDIYLILCSTYSGFDQANPITNRSVYKINHDNSGRTTRATG